MQVRRKPLHIPVIKCSIDLVEQAEGCGTDLQDSKIQRCCHEGLLATGQQRDGLDLLSGRLHADLDAAGQGLLGIFQDQLAFTAAKHFLKYHTEVVVDLLEFRNEDGGHFLGNIADDRLQLTLGVQHIVPLLCQVGIAFIDTGIFLDSAQVGRTQGGDLPL